MVQQQVITILQQAKARLEAKIELLNRVAQAPTVPDSIALSKLDIGMISQHLSILEQDGLDEATQQEQCIDALLDLQDCLNSEDERMVYAVDFSDNPFHTDGYERVHSFLGRVNELIEGYRAEHEPELKKLFERVTIDAVAVAQPAQTSFFRTWMQLHVKENVRATQVSRGKTEKGFDGTVLWGQMFRAQCQADYVPAP